MPTTSITNGPMTPGEVRGKLRCAIIHDGDLTYTGYYFWCPGCDNLHRIIVVHSGQNAGGKLPWDFNGDPEKPTFYPSLKVFATGYCCHSWVKEGKMEFLEDCTHKNAGKTLEIQDFATTEGMEYFPSEDV